MSDLRAGEPWATYVRRLDEMRRGSNLPPDRVPATFLVAEVNGMLVGRVSIRHELNDFLADFGGHIGYGVGPASGDAGTPARCSGRHLSSPAPRVSAECS